MRPRLLSRCRVRDKRVVRLIAAHGRGHRAGDSLGGGGKPVAEARDRGEQLRFARRAQAQDVGVDAVAACAVLGALMVLGEDEFFPTHLKQIDRLDERARDGTLRDLASRVHVEYLDRLDRRSAAA
jgi:hypothetical protein